jgi:hypothetical protein
MTQLDTDDIRKRCKHAIANTPVGRHLGRALDEVDRLREGLQKIAEISRHSHENTTQLAWLLQIALIEDTARELMGDPKLIPTKDEVSSE